MMLKRFFILVSFFACIIAVNAQHEKKEGFSPEKFEEDLKNYIVKEAALSKTECDKFFPIYKEMRSKQLKLFERQRNLFKAKPNDEEGFKKQVQERDNIELEQKRIQQKYHNKFFEVLPASKVCEVIRAEDTFHRRMLRQWGHQQKPARKRGK